MFTFIESISIWAPFCGSRDNIIFLKINFQFNFFVRHCFDQMTVYITIFADEKSIRVDQWWKINLMAQTIFMTLICMTTVKVVIPNLFIDRLISELSNNYKLFSVFKQGINYFCSALGSISLDSRTKQIRIHNVINYKHNQQIIQMNSIYFGS